MKIHTNLMPDQMLTVLRNAHAPIEYLIYEPVGSRTHAYGYHVRLSGSGQLANTGLTGAGYENAATWDEWGAWFGALFELDPEARCGGTVFNPVYRNASHFHYLTGERFRYNDLAGGHLPTDTHPRHQWEYDGTWGDHGTSSHHCTKCSAVRSPFIAGCDWS